MRKTKPIVYGDQDFWGYDVAAGIFLKYLIGAAQVSAEANTPWLSEAISDWRVQAVISDFQLTPGENWSAEQRADSSRMVNPHSLEIRAFQEDSRIFAFSENGGDFRALIRYEPMDGDWRSFPPSRGAVEGRK